MSCHHEEAQGSLATERDRGICFSLEDFFRESEKQIPRGLKPARNDNFHEMWDVNRATRTLRRPELRGNTVYQLLQYPKVVQDALQRGI